MSRTIPVTNLTVRHMWEAYADNLLAANPEWKGTRHNKIRNFYIHRVEALRKIEVLSYKTFRRIIEVFFLEARKAIIMKGESVHINECGRILATRVQRNHRRKKKMVDWQKTRQQELVWNDEKQKFSYAKTIYFTNDDYCCINWLKNPVRNSSFYMFEPTTESSSSQEGSKTPGFRQEFSEALNHNKLLKFKYLYAPLTLKRKEPEQDTIQLHSPQPKQKSHGI